MGYNEPKKRRGGTKKFEKQYIIFEPYIPIMQVKVEFLSTELCWRLKR